VLVHLYEEKGAALLEELEGMFAFVILDELKREILLVRDRFGEKPLYWAELPGRHGLAFASEMKALAPLQGLNRELDFSAIAQFLAIRCIPAPRTHFLGVRKLMAAQALKISASCGTQTWRYYKPVFPRSTATSCISRDEAVEEVRRRLLQSVRLRLRSDVPVAAFLSGGIDSTFVASAVRELAPCAKFSTFCASFEDDSLNEAAFAREVAQHIASDHHEVRFSSAEILDSFDALIDHYDEPFADASMFPTFAVCRAARNVATVMLSGDGGDECFAGYRDFFRYHTLHSLRRLPGTNAAAGAILRFWPKWLRGIGPLTFLSKSDWGLLYPQETYDRVLKYFKPVAQESARRGLEELHQKALDHARLSFPRSAIEATTMEYLPEQTLVKVDRASMRSALECRTPFLDRNVMEFVRGLPASHHFERGLGKALLRRALPAWVSDRIRWRNKRGFTPPLAAWLGSVLRPKAEACLAEFPAILRGAIDPRPARHLLERHLEGEDCSDALFRWMVLSRRFRQAA
jgi:asparagine synthase (glutamine-hydrolysing)